jgi:2-iminobutanoate/2-iminopropanoate deaminase
MTGSQTPPGSEPRVLPPLSASREAGPFVFVSGQVGVDPASGAVSGPDVTTQTEQVLRNLARVLEGAGLDFSDVVKTTVFLTEAGDFARMNAVYSAHFSVPFPTRSTVAVSALARPELVVEVEAIALRRDRGT